MVRLFLAGVIALWPCLVTAASVEDLSRALRLEELAVLMQDEGVEDSRRIEVNHANWHRNKVSLGMAVIDVSEDNDWSAVRLESNPGAFGRVYPVTGFILPTVEDS